MKKAKILLLVIFFLLFTPKITLADNLCPQNACENISDLNLKVSCLSEATDKCGKQRVDLTSQINYMDSQIKLTTTKIYQTQNQILQLDDQIASLSGQIDRLANSLGDLSKILLERIVQTYKKGDPSPFYLFLSANKFSDLLSRLKYLRLVQAHDKKLMFAMQQTKDNYTDQKKAREEKKTQQENLRRQLEAQKTQLAQQIKDRLTLLEVTRNDERRYQDLLNAARAEQQALLKILAGQGSVAKIGEVKVGDTIGSIIAGRSACSTGTHLHFEVQVSGSTVNPANYLKNISLNYDYNTGNIPEFISPGGSWDWPVEESVIIEQIYGMSYWARVLNYYGGGPHTGIDMNSQNGSRVKAVRDGTLYKGAVSCGGGSLPFARVDQADNTQTYYLHMQ